MTFVNRVRELEQLDAWWRLKGWRLGLVWGRRRVGKTLLVQEFADRSGARTIHHTFAGRPAREELRRLWEVAAPDAAGAHPDDWEDALNAIAAQSLRTPTLLVLDEYQEGVAASPELPSVIRKVWDARRPNSGTFHMLICGSAVRTMDGMQEERAPLYGRFDLRLLVHPFEPHEAALMLPGIPPTDRALVWCLLGGSPFYLAMWDQSLDVRSNIEALFCSPSARLLSEGDLLMRGEMLPDIERQVLFAISDGKTQHNEIKQAVRAEPTRQLERLAQLRLVERVEPVSEAGSRTRRRSHRISDNFLAFWLGSVARFRGEIERGLGETILDVLIEGIDDFAGPRYEEAFRQHLRRLARQGELGKGVVAVGPYWRNSKDGDIEIDAVVLAGRRREAVLVGEAKWTREVNGRVLVADLERKAESIENRSESLRYAVCAREKVKNAPKGVLTVTAADIFS